MTTQEFSDAFDVLLNSYNIASPFGEQTRGEEVALDEYEKSVYLTRAQEEVIRNLYNGKNLYGESFESTEELRRYLESLIKTKVYNKEEQITGTGASPNSVFYKLLPDVAFITMEQITYDDELLGCYNGSIASVYPVTQDEYNRLKNNPFRGPTKYKAIRMDSEENSVELISKYKIGEYMIRYLSRPTPIILVDLPEGLSIEGEREKKECKVHPMLHNTILERAVQMAFQIKGISVNK